MRTHSFFTNFTYSATGDYEYLIKTTLKNKSTGIETTYYLKTADQLIAVGHGMCSGEFNLYNGDMFEIEFSLMDASGTSQSGKAKELHLNDLNKKLSTDTFALDKVFHPALYTVSKLNRRQLHTRKA